MTTQHTCGGPVFGRKTAGCPRCDEMMAGAAPVKGWGHAAKERTRVTCDAIHFHYNSGECQRTCGPVCVRFDP